MSAHLLDRLEDATAKKLPTQVAPATSPEDSIGLASSLPTQRRRRRRWPWIVGLIACIISAAVGIPWIHESFTTVSTDDAYVNGHVTLVAPRVNGQVKRVLV